MVKKVKALQELARKMVGDGKSPNLFFVSVEGVIVHIGRTPTNAYDYWSAVSRNPDNKNTALEDRKHGTIADKQKDRKDGTVIIDDFNRFFFPNDKD